MKLKTQRFPELVRQIIEARSINGRKFYGGRVLIMNVILKWRFAKPMSNLPAPDTIAVGTWFAN